MRSSLAKLATACLVCAAALAGCSSQATFTQGIGGSYAELNGLTKTVECDYSLPFASGAIDIELEEGTVDIEIVDIQRIGADDDDFAELDTIAEEKGLGSGDRMTFSDDDGEILLRITSSDGATGKLTFSEN